ncbi:MAG: hypothetical protein U1E39_07865 [Planctomycetota bacterium]
MNPRRLPRRVAAGAWLALVGAAAVGAALAGCGEPASASKPVATPVATPTAEPAPTPPRPAEPPVEPDAAPAPELAPGPAALDLARRLGRPLLVFLVPHDAADRADRARALDLLLQRDLVAARVPLVFAHGVALAPADLEAVAPGASVGAPFAVVVETDGRGGATQWIPWPAALAGPSGYVSFDLAHRAASRDAQGPDRAWWDLARALEAALVGGPPTVARRAAQRAAAGDPAPDLFGADAREGRRRRAVALAEAWRRDPIPGTQWVPIAEVAFPAVRGDGAWCGTGGSFWYRGSSRFPVREPEFELDDAPDDGGPIRVRLRERPAPRPAIEPLRDDDDERPPGLASPGTRLRLEFLPPVR